MSGAQQVVFQNQRSFGLGPNGPGLYLWGSNDSGQLGQGNLTLTNSPVQVGRLSTWTNIGGSSLSTTFAVKSGELWSWGTNYHGVLGIGNTTSYYSPKQVGALTTWVTTVNNNSGEGCFAIKTNGSLWVWGYNRFRVFGSSSFANYALRSSPVQVGTDTNWSKIESTSQATIALKTTGTIWGWGANNGGVIGFSTPSAVYLNPTQIGSSTWSSISMSPNVSFGVQTDGTLWIIGGQFNATSYYAQTQIGALTNWATISALANGALMTKTNGTLWSMGTNDRGQLGIGNTTTTYSPVQVGALTTWSKVSAHRKSSMALKTDGTIWTWGWNNNGQLGSSNFTYFSSPVQVGALTTWNFIRMQDYDGGAILG